MPTCRSATQTWKSSQVLEGAGVRLNRVFGNREAERMDPFLLLDYFHSDNPEDFMSGFPWHPHRGIETVTYMLKGRVEHGDSLGNRGVIGPGDVQWMTAGSGIIHEEMPKNDDGIQGFEQPVPADHSAFIFVFEGEVAPDASGRRLKDQMVAQFGGGNAVRVATAGSPARFLLVAGTPLREPIAWYGPLVMNTEEELRQAFEEYRSGTFIR